MAPLWAVLLLVVSVCLVGVAGHGRLMDPPARNAMWRFGYPNPVNYNDNELYCGGFVVHYKKNKGRCGVCGDNYKDKMPRDHEVGGMYGNGIVVKRYISGQVIDIEAELTTNHWGYMEVKLCPHNERYKEVTQECLDQYPLPIEGTTDSHFIIPDGTGKKGVLKWRVKLPDRIICSNCVIQWKYFAGNTWGFYPNGTLGAVGVGEQETFINCADVSIITIGGTFPGDSLDNPWQLYFRGSFPGMTRDENTKPGPSGLTPLVVRSQLCVPVASMRDHRDMPDWCRKNCLNYPPNCNSNYCKCVTECEGVGILANEPNADRYCHQECFKYPSNCSEALCHCY